MSDDAFAPNAARRLAEPEQMDAPGVDDRKLVRALRFIRIVNAALGYTRALLGHLQMLTSDWPVDRTLRVLDVATGSADVPAAVERWARQRGIKVNVVGLDLHARTLADAQRFTAGRIPLVRGDALRLPFEDGAFDIVMTSMFLHHLPSDVAADVLREMNRVAAVGVVAADIVRDRRAYRWIKLFTLAADPMVRHDARVSVRQAFTLAEAEQLRTAAGLNFAHVHSHFGHRFIIAGRKFGPLSR